MHGCRGILFFCASNLSKMFATQPLFVVKFTIHTILSVSLWMCVLCVYECVWMCTNVFWVVYLTLETARVLRKNQIIRFHKTMTLLHLWNIFSFLFSTLFNAFTICDSPTSIRSSIPSSCWSYFFPNRLSQWQRTVIKINRIVQGFLSLSIVFRVSRVVLCQCHCQLAEYGSTHQCWRDFVDFSIAMDVLLYLKAIWYEYIGNNLNH